MSDVQHKRAARVPSLIKAVRRAAGITQAELARRMGITQGRVTQLEQQGSAVHLGTIERAARAAGVRVRWTVDSGADSGAGPAQVSDLTGVPTSSPR